MTKKFIGAIERVTHYNPDDNYTIMSVLPETEKESITVIANIIDPMEGMSVEVEGEEVYHRIYGKQIKATTCAQCIPSTVHGLWKFLSGGTFKGIGEGWAKKIVDKFGEDTINVLDNEPNRLLEIPRFGEIRKNNLARQWEEQRVIIDVMVFLQKYGISTRFATKIYKQYGESSISVLTDDPYVLVHDIDGIGFRKADEIALSMGLSKNSPKRICAAVEYVMQRSEENGNTFDVITGIVSDVVSLLGVEKDEVFDCINEMCDYGELVKSGERIFLPKLWKCETNIAKFVIEATDGGIYEPEATDKEIEEVETILRITYDEKQRKALKMAVRNPFCIITGGPGTGKTTLTRGLIYILEKRGMKVTCAAPTGKAADRLSEATGHDASTIHRMLKYNPSGEPSYGPTRCFPTDVLILDESSMVNVPLMNTLLKAMSHDTKIILVGDVDQLPCIGAGNILSDIMESKACPYVKLEFVFRQSGTSNITLAAYDVNSGSLPNKYNSKESDFFFVEMADDERILSYTMELVKDRLPAAYGYEPTDIQVISPMKDGILGVKSLNEKLQSSLNPDGEHIDYGFCKFRVGDKVMQTKNNYKKEVFNGETGTIKSHDKEERVIYVDFKGRIVEYEYMEMDELTLAYAITVHKSQGSEYKAVIMPITPSHHIMLKRNLIYTGITRAKKLCLVIGHAKELLHGAKTTDTVKRNTYLSTLIEEMKDDTFIDLSEGKETRERTIPPVTYERKPVKLVKERQTETFDHDTGSWDMSSGNVWNMSSEEKKKWINLITERF